MTGRIRSVMKTGWLCWIMAAELLAVSAVVAQEDPDLRVGRALSARKQYEVALGSFRAVIAMQPDQQAAYVEAGRCLIALNRMDEAIELLLPWEDRKETSADLSSVLGQARYWDGVRRLTHEPDEASLQFMNAAINLSRAVRKDPAREEALYYLGLTKLLSGAKTWPAAADAFRALVARQPRQPMYHRKLAETLHQLERFQEAAEAYEQAAAFTEKHFTEFLRDTWARAGECHGRAGDTARAAETFRKAFALAPDQADTFQRIWNGFGAVLENRKAGVELLRSLATERPEATLPPYYLGFVLISLGDHAGARKAFEACLKTPGGQKLWDVWARVGEYCFYEDKDEAKARHLAERTLEGDPGNQRATTLLQVMVKSRFDKQEWIEAENLTRVILDHRPTLGAEWSNLGLFLVKQRRLKEAWWAFEKALQYAPDNPIVLESAATVLQYHSLGVVDPHARAVALYERALELKPDFTQAMENLGTLYGERGELEKARELLEAVVEQNPGRAVAMRELNKVRRKLRARSVGPSPEPVPEAEKEE